MSKSVTNTATPKSSFIRLKWLISAGILAIIVIFSAMFLYSTTAIPTVQGYWLKGNVKKVSYNAPIKVVFDQSMDKSSVESAFHIEPNVPGKIDWTGNTLIFYPKDRLETGKDFTVTVEKKAKTVWQKQMAEDYEEVYRITDAPKVVLFSPAPDSTVTDLNSKITVLFDRPMTSLTSLRQGESQIPQLTITPELKGRYKWLGTSSFSFIPEKLKFATKYTITVPKAIKSADGGVSEQDFTYTFFTPKPELLLTSPEDRNQFNGPETKIKMTFNQPMSLESAKSSISVFVFNKDSNKGKNISFEPESTQEAEAFSGLSDQSKWAFIGYEIRYENKDDARAEIIENMGADVTTQQIEEMIPSEENLQKTLILIPSKKLPFDSLVAVKAAKGFKGAEGDSVMETDQHFSFHTVGKLKVVSTDPSDKSSTDNFYNVRFTFSQPIDIDSFKDKIQITPPNIDKDTTQEIKPNLFNDFEDKEININYDFKPSTDYRIVIKAGGKDKYGQSLEEDYTLVFKTKSLPPYFELMSKSDISVLDAGKPQIYYIKSVNADILKLNLKKLSDEEFRKIYAGGYLDTNSLMEVSGPFTRFEKKLKKEFNKDVYTKIDLAKDAGQKLSPGIYFLSASSDQVLDSVNQKPIIQRQVFVLTSAGLAVKKSRDSILVWATSLKDGSPVGDMELTVSEYGSNINLKGKTDNMGIAEIKLPEYKSDESYAYHEYTITGKKGDDYTMSHSTWSDGISPWNFNIDFDAYPSQYFIYTYTDRPIYRPGNDVFFKGILRKDNDASFALPLFKTVHVKIKDSQDETLFEKDVVINDNGTFNGQMKLGEKTRTGYYNIEISLPSEVPGPQYSNTFYGNFMVAEYRKPDYELGISAGKEGYINGDKAIIAVKGAYFFGAPMPQASIEWTVRSQDYYFFINSDSQSPYSSKWYSFSDDGNLCYWGCQGNSAVVSSGKAKLNEKGEYAIDLPLDIKGKKISQFYTVEATAYDLNNQSVSNRITIPVHKGEYYTGIMNQEYIVKKGEQAKFDVITVDPKGMPVKGKSVEVSFYKRQWNTIKKKNVDGGFYYENGFEDSIVEKKQAVTDEKGYAKVSFDTKDGGMFRAVVLGKDSKGNEITASVSIYVTSGDFINWGRENNDKIELVPDKLEYKPGETAHILIKSPYQNTHALLTLERQSLLDKRVIEIKSNSETIDVPITEKSVPNLFVSVLLVKGSGESAGIAEPAVGAPDERDVAAFKIGYTTLQVNTSSKKLNIEVKADREKYHPGDEVTLTIKTTDNVNKPIPAEVSVGVVDKSVLSLTENVTADLLTAFYRKRMLGVSTAHTLTKALSRVNVQVEAGLKGGGGGGIQKRGNFKDTAYWEAVAVTDANGDAQVKFKIPDNLTTWQTMVIGVTKDTIVGSQKSEFIVTKDVLIRPILPRFLIQKDTIKTGAIVHNYLDKAVNLNVSLEATGVKLLSDGNRVISLNPKEEKKVEWTAEVSDSGQAVFTFKAVAADDPNTGDILEQKLPIHPYSFPEIVATSLVISDNDKHSETIWLPHGVDMNFGELKITIASTLASSISQGIEYLVNFPYGCAEQTASSLLSNVVAKQVSGLPGMEKSPINEKDLKKNVESGLQAIYKYQQSSGGWGIWSTSETTPYLSTYILFVLNEAKKAGYTVDDSVIKSGKDFLKNYIKEHPLKDIKAKVDNTSYEANVRAYALYVLSEAGETDLAMAYNLYEFSKNLSIFGKAYLAMDLNILLKSNESIKDDLKAKISVITTDILNNAKETPRGIHFEESRNEYRLFDTNARTTALVLQMLSRIQPDHPYISKILRNMLMEKKDGHYASTQETAITLLALIEYLKQSKELEPSYNGTVTVGGTEKLNKSFTQNNLNEQDVISMSLKELSPDNVDNEITFSRSGTGKMYADLNLKYYLPTEKMDPRDEGIVVTHEYFTLNETNSEKLLDKVKVGETIKAKITVLVPEDRYYVMVEDYLPAGLEGVDFNLLTSQQDLLNTINNENPQNAGYYGDFFINPFNYSEIRDDRMMYFADYLPKGVYEIEFFVRATTPGVYHDLPVLAQELYFPEVFGRSEGKMFEVTE